MTFQIQNFSAHQNVWRTNNSLFHWKRRCFSLAAKGKFVSARAKLPSRAQNYVMMKRKIRHFHDISRWDSVDFWPRFIRFHISRQFIYYFSHSKQKSIPNYPGNTSKLPPERIRAMRSLLCVRGYILGAIVYSWLMRSQWDCTFTLIKVR